MVKVLSFIEMIISTSLNRDPELIKFFIEETTKVPNRFKSLISQEARGTQTFIPLKLLIEFLKREQIRQNPEIKFKLYSLICDLLKLGHRSVYRYITIESEFALHITSKLLFYLSLVPQEVSMFSKLHSDSTQVYLLTRLDLKTQIEKACSSECVKAFQSLHEFMVLFNSICNIAESSEVEWRSSENIQSPTLRLLDQLCYFFHTEILLGFFLEDFSDYQTPPFRTRINKIRTSYQIFLHILKQATNKQLIQTIFSFLFGTTDSEPEVVADSLKLRAQRSSLIRDSIPLAEDPSLSDIDKSSFFEVTHASSSSRLGTEINKIFSRVEDEDEEPEGSVLRSTNIFIEDELRQITHGLKRS